MYLFWCTPCWHQQFSSQDLISTEYSVAYSNYEPTNSSLPPSDSQTSLHSASQLATAANVNLGPNRHSTVLNVTDPRFSATYGNPYLRSDLQQTVIFNFNNIEGLRQGLIKNHWRYFSHLYISNFIFMRFSCSSYSIFDVDKIWILLDFHSKKLFVATPI